MSAELTPAKFVQKWARVDLPERAASQEHFLDLCRLLGQPTPAEADATGEEYTFEKGVAVTDAASAGSSGQRGFADVWWRGKFAWEYKRKDKYKSLIDAYRQLSQYREALENPPLLIVSDIGRTEIHTNFTGTRKEIHTIALADLTQPEKQDLLRRVFSDPNSFKPGLASWQLTEQAAADFARLSDSLRQRKIDPHAAPHFLMKCMFCLFAEDVKLLPGALFSKLLKANRGRAEKLAQRLTVLFRAMARGGDFGVDEIPFFNGGLFKETETALSLTNAEAADARIRLASRPRESLPVPPVVCHCWNSSARGPSPTPLRPPRAASAASPAVWRLTHTTLMDICSLIRHNESVRTVNSDRRWKRELLGRSFYRQDLAGVPSCRR